MDGVKPCRHNKSWVVCGGYMEWCYECGAIRFLRALPINANYSVPTSGWVKPAGRGGENPFTPEDWARGRGLLNYFMENTRNEHLREDLAHLMEISFHVEGLPFEELLALFIR